MNWLNLEIRTLRSPAYMGSDPVERATWLNVLAHCCEQENGGRIVGAARWKDRQWQQLCGVTLREVRRTSRLLTWEGDDLLAHGYDRDKEAEVQEMRALGRARTERKAASARSNGALGGRPKSLLDNPTETQRGDNPDDPTRTQRDDNPDNPTGTHRREEEGKEKKEERKEKEKEKEEGAPARPFRPLRQAQGLQQAQGFQGELAGDGVETETATTGRATATTGRALPKSLAEVQARAASFPVTGAVPRPPDAGFVEWWFDEQEKRGWCDPETGRRWHDWVAAFHARWRGYVHRQGERNAPRSRGNGPPASRAQGPQHLPGDNRL